MAERYTDAIVYVNGRVLAESSSVDVARTSGAQDVETIVKGWAGISPGSKKVDISIDNAVPSLDFELDAGNFFLKDEPVDLAVYAAGRTMRVKGFFLDDSFNYAVNSNAKLTFKFRGGRAKWEK